MKKGCVVNHREKVVNGDVEFVENGFIDMDNGFIGQTLSTVENLITRAAQYFLGHPNLAALRGGEAFEKAKRTKFLNELVVSGKLGNRQIWDLDQDKKNRINKIVNNAKFVDLKFKTKLKKIKKKITPEDAKILDDILKNPDLAYDDDWTLSDGEIVPIEVIETLREMRQVIDDLSTEFVQAGVIDGDLVSVFDNNLGAYVTRQYRIHFDKSWEKTVLGNNLPGSVYNKAKLFFAKQFNDQIAHLEDRIQFAEERLQLYNDAITVQQNANQPVSPDNLRKVHFWDKRLEDLKTQKKLAIDNLADLDAYISAYLKDYSKSFGGRPRKLGSKDEGIIKERAGSVKSPVRKAIEDKITRAQKGIVKVNRKIVQLERELAKEKGKKKPVPLKIRDKKILFQARRSKYKSRLKRVNEQLADKPESKTLLKKKAEIEAKIDDMSDTIDDLNAQIQAKRNQQLTSVPKIEEAINKLETAHDQLMDKLADLNDDLRAVADLDIPKEIRDLLGEVHDPRMNFIATVHKQAHLLENHKFISAIAEAGVGKFLFESPTGDHVHKLNFKDSDPVGPVKTFYTTKAVADAFENYNVSSKLGEAYQAAAFYASATKMNLTVLYHLVGLRNLFSASFSFQAAQGDFTTGAAAALNWMFMDGNIIGIALRSLGVGTKWGTKEITGPSLLDKLAGHLGGEKDNKFVQFFSQMGLGIAQSALIDTRAIHDINRARNLTYGVDVWEKPLEELQDDYQEAFELGLFDEDFTFAPYKEAIQAYKGEKLPETVRPDEKGTIEKVAGVGRKTFKFLQKKSIDRYRASDNAGRYLRYLIERTKIARAEFGKSWEELSPEEQADIRPEAAEIAKQTYPTISRVPPLIKELSKFPLLGDFVTFPVSMWMVQAQTLRQASKEIRNPKRTAIGVQRLMGIAGLDILATAGVKAIASMFTEAYDDEDDDRLRHLIYSFSRDSKFVAFKSINNDGTVNPNEFHYIDMGPQLPASTNNRMLVLALSALANKQGKYGPRSDELAISITETLATFASPSIAGERFMEAVFNTKELGSGRPIVPKTESFQAKTTELVGHALGFKDSFTRIETGGLIPGTIPMMARTAESLLGIPTSSGALRDPRFEALGWIVGTRVSPVDVETSLSYEHYYLREGTKELERDWRAFTNRSRFDNMDPKDFWKHPDVKLQIRRKQNAFNRLQHKAMTLDQVAIDQRVDNSIRRGVLKQYGNHPLGKAALLHQYQTFNFKNKKFGVAPPVDLPKNPDYFKK